MSVAGRLRALKAPAGSESAPRQGADCYAYVTVLQCGRQRPEQRVEHAQVPARSSVRGLPIEPSPQRRRSHPHGDKAMVDEHRDTVVVDDSGGSGMGAILGIIAIIILLAAVWYFALGPGTTGTNNNNNTNDNGGNAPA